MLQYPLTADFEQHHSGSPCPGNIFSQNQKKSNTETNIPVSACIRERNIGTESVFLTLLLVLLLELSE